MTSIAVVHGPATSLFQTLVPRMLSHGSAVPAAGSADCDGPASFWRAWNSIRTLGFVSLELVTELKRVEDCLTLVT